MPIDLFFFLLELVLPKKGFHQRGAIALKAWVMFRQNTKKIIYGTCYNIITLEIWFTIENVYVENKLLNVSTATHNLA